MIDDVFIAAIAGVLGYKDVNSFSLEVIVSPPVRSLDLKPGSTNEVKEHSRQHVCIYLYIYWVSYAVLS